MYVFNMYKNQYTPYTIRTITSVVNICLYFTCSKMNQYNKSLSYKKKYFVLALYENIEPD